MYNFSQIYSALKSQVGWRRSSSNTYKFSIPASIGTSLSGLWFLDPFFTTDNFFDVEQSNLFGQTYATWINTTTYYIGTRILYDKTLYECIVEESVGEQPDVTPMSWLSLGKKSEYASTLLEKHSMQSLSTLLAKVFTFRNNATDFKEYSLVGLAPSNGDAITPQNLNASRFVGIAIQVTNKIGLTLDLKRIGTRFKLAQTLPVYLYDTNSKDPLFTWDIDVLGGYQYTQFELPAEVKLHYLNTSGRFFIGYYESDLINGNYAGYTQPNCCNTSMNVRQYKEQFSKYVKPYASIQSFSVQNTYLQGTDNFILANPDTNVISYENTDLFIYGLSLGFQNICDITKVITDNAGMFAMAWQLQANLDFINLILMTNRNNFAVTLKERAADFAPIAQKNLDEAVQSLIRNFTNIDAYGGSPCFQNSNKTVKISVR
jgi:hypothetical protein